MQVKPFRNMCAIAADPEDTQARSELVYDSAMAENGVLKIGKVTDFQGHMIQRQYGAYTHSNHGLGLAVIIPNLYRHLAPCAPEQFTHWAMEVWGITAEGKSESEIAQLGIDAFKVFIREMGLPTTFAEMGTDSSDEVLRNVADTAVLTGGCAKKLERDEIFEILKECR